MRRFFGTVSAVAWLVLCSVQPLPAQGGAPSISGRVTDDAGQPLANAQVLVADQATGTTKGAVTDQDGRYQVAGLRPGTYRISARFIGYNAGSRDNVRLAGGESLSLDFALGRGAITLQAVEVFAERAIELQTPVAHTTVEKVQVQQQLASQDLPMVLNTTPSVYATMQGGGAGDARVNIRGFDQRNTAVMINGVPVNDMENGWVYWSNWDGLGDAASSIQVQRGLSTVNLATPSIGGILNVITDPTAQRAGLSYKQEFGSGKFLKETVTLNTGERGPFALSANVVRKTGQGLFKNNGGLATYTDAWAYYAAASFRLSERNRLEAYAVGAPQKHGQNLYKLNVAQISHSYAQKLGVSAAALAAIAESGRLWSPNVNRVDPSYTGLQYASSGPGAGTFERQGDGYINERENYFHKPQVNLNYFSYLGNGLNWSTVAYYSGGNGGGSGTLGSIVYDFTYKQRVPNWDATIARNRTNAGGRSTGILRSSVNNQWTIGAISKLRKDFAAGLSAEVGVDWRTASIDHYRDVRDLLGGQFWLDNTNQFTGPRNTVFGDKIDYYNTNKVNWMGGYVQAEKSSSRGTVYGMFGLAQNAYRFTDHFKMAPGGGELQLSSGNLQGYQAKGGVSLNLGDEWSVFGNAGYVSKVPIFDAVIDDINGKINSDPKNEKFLSFEAGTSYRSRSRGLSFDANVYHTTWRDREFTFYVPVDDIFAQILGVDSRYMGVELSGAYQPLGMFRFDAAVSVGNWKHLNDAGGRAVAGDRQSTTLYNYYIKDLKISDQPQTQFAYAASVYPIQGVWLQIQGHSNFNYYAAFDPFGRTDPTDRAQSWKVPGYTVFDFHGSWRVTNLIPVWRGADIKVFGHVLNLFDTMFIQDATDNSGFNGFYNCTPNTRPCAADRGHDAEAAEVYLGLPRRFNAGFEVIF